MPELPEVQTIKSQLTSYLPLKIKSTHKSKFINSINHTKIPNLKNKSIVKIDRHGKCLIFNFDNNTFLLSHLGMSGSWRISESKSTAKHTHFSFNTSTHYLSYVDPRRFGHMYFFNSHELETYLSKLGPDLKSKKFSPAFILKSIQRFPNKEIKPFLLDQKYFCGSGNYIANEVCALSNINPLMKCSLLNERHAKKIHQAFRSILNAAIKNQGVTFQGGYSDAFGNKGQGVQNLVVFHQKVCGMCKKTQVKKVIQKQRGTFFCSTCQPLG